MGFDKRHPTPSYTHTTLTYVILDTRDAVPSENTPKGFDKGNIVNHTLWEDMSTETQSVDKSNNIYALND